MKNKITKLNAAKINKVIADRSNVFYWQTDRAIEPEEAGLIWADRHRYFNDNELLQAINSVLVDNKLVSIQPRDSAAQTNLGNVSSVRVGTLSSGQEVVIRCFPKGIVNGYFHVEAAAADAARGAGLPSYKTLAIHDFAGDDDFAFHVLEKLPGTVIKLWLEAHPEDEAALLTKIGQMMARLHKIQVDGFGPFDNNRAKGGKLVGLHDTIGQAMRAGLKFNLEVLAKEGILSAAQTAAINALFADENPSLQLPGAVLVHNDFADWNLLTDGREVTGILDWDECVAGDAIADIACWSTFFEPERLQPFLKGYWNIAQKPVDFQAKFELFRLRYILSKMTLRIRRYSWEPTEVMRTKIETGKTHLSQSLKYFSL